MSGGCVSELKEREREREDEERERGDVRGRGKLGRARARDGRRVPRWVVRRVKGPGGEGRASVGKRVASASTLFHPPTTLPLLLGPRGAEEDEEEEDEEEEEEVGGQGGQGVDRGWRAGGKRELGERPRGAR